jgi:phosphate transport system substrate-binding protein
MKRLLPAMLLVAAATSTVYANKLTGAGSTFVYPALSQWAQQYEQKTGAEINYQAIGSGAGIAQIKAKTVDFAATDKLLSQADLTSNHLTQFPIIMGGIVMAENVKGIKQLTLTGPVIAQIYLGDIKQWNDPAIQGLNKGVALPDQVITVVYRADGSGTTYNFTRYLSTISKPFASNVGSDTVVKFPVGVGGKGNAGVANYIKMIPGSIGYVEYAYAIQSHLSVADMKVDSAVVSPNMESFKNNTWPMMATTYALLPQNNANLKASEAFFTYVFAHPEVATQLSYVAIPTNITNTIVKGWK